ncbi:hypothetical protein RBB84_02520 [Rhodococcus sp. D-6]|uniref:DUF927 domain-containing protein n=1 Tax=Rhodococcus sp. D-6 TaxID=1387842 RepID=A0AAU7UY58_9NOCA|nr:hypothetical protein [Rhodococcus sp. HS-D2]
MTKKSHAAEVEPDRVTYTVHEIVDYICRRHQLVWTTNGDIYALDPRNTKIQYDLDDDRFYDHAAATLFDDELRGDRTIPPTTWASAVRIAKGRVRQRPNQNRIPVALRAYHDPANQTLIIDLQNDDDEFVQITPGGWEIVDRPGGVIFTRSENQNPPLPRPVRTAPEDRDRIVRAWARAFGVGVDDSRFLLISGWSTLVFLSDLDRPGLGMYGPSGSGKTDRSKFVLSLVDPVDELDGVSTAEAAEVTSRESYVVTFDNLGNSFTDTFSDWFSKLVTGYMAKRRKLYTTNGVSRWKLKAPAMFTGLNVPTMKEDAKERLVAIEWATADADPAGKTAVRQRWPESLRSEVLGVVLDALVVLLGEYDTPRPELAAQRDLGRLKDYASMLHVLDSQGWPGGSRMTAYLDAMGTARVADAEENLIVRLVRQWFRSEAGSKTTEISPSDLLAALARQANLGEFHGDHRVVGMGKTLTLDGDTVTTKQLGNRLRESERQFRAVGVQVEKTSKGGSKGVRWTFSEVEVPEEG